MVRDRKEEFVTIAQSHVKERKPSKSKVYSSKQTQETAAVFVLGFLEKVGDIHEDFGSIDTAITDVIRIQAAVLEFSDTDNSLHKTYRQIKNDLTSIANKIGKLEESVVQQDFKGTNTELRICNTQVITLKKKLSSCISHYYSIQEEFKNKCKARVRRQAQIAGADTSKLNMDDLMSCKTDVFLKTILPDYDVSHYYMGEIKKRHEELLNLENSLEELRNLFFDLALVIQIDFPLIDRIDKHAIMVDQLCCEGKENLQSYRSALRITKYKRCIAIMCFLILVGFLVMVVVVLSVV